MLEDLKENAFDYFRCKLNAAMASHICPLAAVERLVKNK